MDVQAVHDKLEIHELLARYAPNVPGAILHRQILSPLDLERMFGLTGGNIMQGSMNLNQLFAMRPVAGHVSSATPRTYSATG